MGRCQLQLSADIDKKPHTLCVTSTKGWNSHLVPHWKALLQIEIKVFEPRRKFLIILFTLMKWRHHWKFKREYLLELLKIYWWWALVSQNSIETRKDKHHHDFWAFELSCHRVNTSDIAETKDVGDKSSSQALS